MKKSLFITGPQPDGVGSCLQFKADSHLVGIDTGDLYGGDTLETGPFARRNSNTLIMKCKFDETAFGDGVANAVGGHDLMAWGETLERSSFQCGITSTLEPYVRAYNHGGDSGFDQTAQSYYDSDGPLTFTGGDDNGWRTFSCSSRMYRSRNLFSQACIDGDSGDPDVGNFVSSIIFANTPEMWIGCGFDGLGHTGGVPSGDLNKSLRIYDVMLVNGFLEVLFGEHFLVPDDPLTDGVEVGGTTFAYTGYDVVHWWRLGYDRNNIGKDYIGRADLDLVNLDAYDIRVDAPDDAPLV